MPKKLNTYRTDIRADCLCRPACPASKPKRGPSCNSHGHQRELHDREESYQPAHSRQQKGFTIQLDKRRLQSITSYYNLLDSKLKNLFRTAMISRFYFYRYYNSLFYWFFVWEKILVSRINYHLWQTTRTGLAQDIATEIFETRQKGNM